MKESSDIGPITLRETGWEAILFVVGDGDECETIRTGKVFTNSSEALWAACDEAALFGADAPAKRMIKFGARSTR